MLVSPLHLVPAPSTHHCTDSMMFSSGWMIGSWICTLHSPSPPHCSHRFTHIGPKFIFCFHPTGLCKCRWFSGSWPSVTASYQQSSTITNTTYMHANFQQALLPSIPLLALRLMTKLQHIKVTKNTITQTTTTRCQILGEDSMCYNNQTAKHNHVFKKN